METPADLNARADAIAGIYDGVSLHTADPGLDGSNVAGGGAVQAVTFTAGGVEGPTADFAAVDGIAWSVVVDFTLTEVATHLGLWDGATFMRGEALQHQLGPGAVPLAFGVGPSAADR